MYFARNVVYSYQCEGTLVARYCQLIYLSSCSVTHVKWTFNWDPVTLCMYMHVL